MDKICYDYGNCKYLIACDSFLGTRDEQQDSYCINANASSVIAAVCDGMGGLSSGQMASYIATKKLSELFKIKLENTEFPVFFETAMDLLDEAVNTFGKQNNETKKAGTTIVAVGIEANKLYWLSCGDSRLYIVRNGEIVQVTTDHNYGAELDLLIENNKITHEQYVKENSQREALMSFIGMGGIEIYDLNTQPFLLQNNDLLLLVSDGLYRRVSSNQMRSVVINHDDPGDVVKELLELASKDKKSSQDNTTIVAVKYKIN